MKDERAQDEWTNGKSSAQATKHQTQTQKDNPAMVGEKIKNIRRKQNRAWKSR